MEPGNPYEAPASGWDVPAESEPADADELGAVLHTLAATLPGKAAASWTVTLHGQHARFVEDSGERSFVLGRSEIPTRVRLGIIGAALLTIAEPVKVTLQMPLEHAHVLKQWLGAQAVQWMTALLGQRRRFSSITAIVFGVLGLLGNNPLLIGYAVIVGALFFLTRLAPTRHLFLAEAAFSLAIAVYFVWGIVFGTLSAWWALFLLMSWIWVPMNVRMYKFFGPPPP
jgi:hypothetical protein